MTINISSIHDIEDIREKIIDEMYSEAKIIGQLRIAETYNFDPTWLNAILRGKRRCSFERLFELYFIIKGYVK